ncbi:MoaD/ThiS family protein [Propionibacteriaceae bacterium Y1685]|uniref:MoaD/ThiS family protein n=1 Tax=Microlunatus sp. Y1700 TaxID=3418487 RepID=UPI003B80530C
MATILIRYWAAARSAAGVESESVEADSCRAALDQVLAARAVSPGGSRELERVLGASSFLVDGTARRRADLARPVADQATLEVLPPFAGG